MLSEQKIKKLIEKGYKYNFSGSYLFKTFLEKPKKAGERSHSGAIFVEIETGKIACDGEDRIIELLMTECEQIIKTN